MRKKIIVISMGGSLIVPDEIDWKLLKRFKELIIKQIKLGKRFIIVAGGGNIARKYQKAVSKIGVLEPDDRDWIGIHSTRLNAHLLRTIFRKYAHPRINKNPYERFDFKEKILIGSGWRPGVSSDYDAVVLAKEYQAKEILNLSNIDYVYDKDPDRYKDARKIKEISWKDFRKIVGNRWDPGMNVPFDPIASRMAQEYNMVVTIMNGKRIKNVENYLNHRKFKGTVIS